MTKRVTKHEKAVAAYDARINPLKTIKAAVSWGGMKVQQHKPVTPTLPKAPQLGRAYTELAPIDWA